MATLDLYCVVKSSDTVTNFNIFSFGATQPHAVSGFYKTILQWVKCLFTEKGTDLSNRNYGTVVASLIGGNYASRADLQDTVVTAVQDATAQLRKYQSLAGVTSAERLLSAQVTGVEVSPSSVDISVTLINVAGDRVSLTLPTGVTPPQSDPRNG